MTFQIEALPYDAFAPLFALDDMALADAGARRMTVDHKPGFPCRVSLQDAEVGETVILVNHTHLDLGSPYDARHAVFVRQDAPQAAPVAGEVPEVLHHRLLSLRAFDAGGMMIAADVVEGAEVAARLDAMFGATDVSFIDIHNAKPGCFAARARRV
ncbi:hypothetical protein ATO6_01435 [Oceanicola sp. 22II-s10i]|uniref:DUF1203 domain-containing protein n=1 Tax=Oceanicola sp. 22II-s10i TaxID=1317116 RepID=UPI000B51E6C8|nr:DUF1203 domain-containing protein [Oceanicola sp. 22II-s10i]OWU85622.1 hypothetical protein ATO6_01435 [Oceanicola sp. 22II-s10i]